MHALTTGVLCCVCCVSVHRDRYFLASLSVNELARCLNDKDRKRTLSLGVLRDLLRRHDFDRRYGDTERREHVASMYFSLVLMVRWCQGKKSALL